MNFFWQLSKKSVVALAAIVLISSPSVHGQTVPRAPQSRSGESHLNLLVLGDSILWGQGLKDEHKAWYRVKVWLQQTAGRDVREKIAAHSGALLELAGPTGAGSAIPLDGEVNSAVPEQVALLNNLNVIVPVGEVPVSVAMSLIESPAVAAFGCACVVIPPAPPVGHGPLPAGGGADMPETWIE